MFIMCLKTKFMMAQSVAARDTRQTDSLYILSVTEAKKKVSLALVPAKYKV